MTRRLPDPTFDQRIADWLEDDPSLAPREVLGTVLAAFPSIDQRRAVRVPWRFPLMNRYLLPLAAALVVVIGAAYLLTRPASDIGPLPSPSASSAPASIEGTWDVAFSRQQMLDAGIVDPGEDNNANYGQFHLTFQDGWWSLSQVAPFGRPGKTSTYTADGAIAHLFSPLDNVTFDLDYTVTPTTLTFAEGGPVTFRVKPWTRIASVVITQTPEPRAFAEYRQARNAVCAEMFLRSMPPDADPVSNPNGAIAALDAVIARGSAEITALGALKVPDGIRAEHLASIQAIADTRPILEHEIELINQGKPGEVQAVDQQTVPLSEAFQQFEQKYQLESCP